MFLESCGNGEDVRIEDDVGRIEIRLLDQQAVGTLADLDLARDGVRLTGLVERHHDHARTIAVDGPRLLQKVLFALLQADRVDDALALQTLQAGFEDRPLRAVDDDRDPGDLRLGRDVIEEGRHRLLGIEHAFVHVDVDQVRAAAHLIRRDANRVGILLGLDQPSKARRAGDVRPLANHLKVAVGTDGQDFEAGELRIVRSAGGWLRLLDPWLLAIGCWLLRADGHP